MVKQHGKEPFSTVGKEGRSYPRIAYTEKELPVQSEVQGESRQWRGREQGKGRASIGREQGEDEGENGVGMIRVRAGYDSE